MSGHIPGPGDKDLLNKQCWNGGMSPGRGPGVPPSGSLPAQGLPPSRGWTPPAGGLQGANGRGRREQLCFMGKLNIELSSNSSQGEKTTDKVPKWSRHR